MNVEVVQLLFWVEELVVEKEFFQQSDDLESIKFGYEVMLVFLRVENIEFSDQVQSLKEEMKCIVSVY